MPTLDDINSLSPVAAKEFFLSCCGSNRWAESMAECRPYWNLQVVFNAADVIWGYLGAEDWREALRNRNPSDGNELPAPLREDLELYRNKFGYGFVMALPLPPPDTLRAEVLTRLEHSLRAEIEISAAEECAIMRSELRKRLTA